MEQLASSSVYLEGALSPPPGAGGRKEGTERITGSSKARVTSEVSSSDIFINTSHEINQKWNVHCVSECYYLT